MSVDRFGYLFVRVVCLPVYLVLVSESCYLGFGILPVLVLPLVVLLGQRYLRFVK